MAAKGSVPAWYPWFLGGLFAASATPILAVTAVAWAYRDWPSRWVLPTAFALELALVVGLAALGVRHRARLIRGMWDLGGGFIAICAGLVVFGSLLGMARPATPHAPSPQRRVAVVGPTAVWSGTTGRVDWDRLAPLTPSKRSPAPWLVAAGGGLLTGVGAVLMGTGLSSAQQQITAMTEADSRATYDAAAADYDAAAGRTRAGYATTGIGLGVALTGVGWGVLR